MSAPTTDGIPPIPRPMLEQAQADLPAPAVVRRWGKFVAWHRSTHGADAPYRMPDWDRHIEFELQDLKTKQAQSSNAVALPAPLKPHELEQAVRDEQYAREAVTFGDWTRGLDERAAGRGEPLSEHDEAFLTWRRTLDRSDARAWGLTSLMAFGDTRRDGGAKCECVRCRTVLRVDANKRVVGQRVMSDAEFDARRRKQLFDLQNSELLDGLGLVAGGAS